MKFIARAKKRQKCNVKFRRVKDIPLKRKNDLLVRFSSVS